MGNGTSEEGSSPLVQQRSSQLREVPAAAGRDSNEALVHALLERFSVLAEACSRFSQEVYRRTGVPPQQDLPGTLKRNLEISRTVFTPGSIDILAVLYLSGTVGFQDIQRSLRLSPAGLERKLRDLESLGLVQRSVSGEPPRKSRYILTHKGSVIARLGEPVFLYLRLASGWFEGVSRGETQERDPSTSSQANREGAAQSNSSGQTLIGAAFLSAVHWLHHTGTKARVPPRAERSASESLI